MIENVFLSAVYKLFPNPANEQLTIQSLINEKIPGSYTIMDILGRLVSAGQLDPSGKTEISLTTLNNGIYFVSLLEGAKVAHKEKLILMK